MRWAYSEIEDQILTLVIKDRNFSILVLGELESSHFENETMQFMYKLIVQYFKTYHGMPSLEETKSMIKAAQLEDRFDYLLAEKIYSQPLTPSAADFIRDNIPGFIKFNKFSRFIQEASILLPAVDHTEQEKFYNEQSQKFKNIMLYNIDTDLGMDLFDVDARYMILKERSSTAIKPHLTGLAKVIGGYSPKELYAYIGPPGQGKSIMLATDAFSAVQQGYNVLYITLEMSPELFGLRLDMGLIKQTSKSILTTPEHVVYLKKRYEELKTMTKCGRMFIKEYPTGAASCLDIEKYLELLRMYKDFVPELVVVDYGDIMKPNGKRTGDRYYDQGMVFMELRALAKEQKFPVLTAMQTNRPSRENRYEVITEDRIADSYDKLRTLDGCFSINPKYLEGQQILNEYFLYVIKNRNNRKDVRLDYTMNKDLMLVGEKRREEEPEEEDERTPEQEEAAQDIRKAIETPEGTVDTETGEIISEAHEQMFNDMDEALNARLKLRQTDDEAEAVF